MGRNDDMSTPQCPDDCPMCSRLKCLLCDTGRWDDGTLQCDHNDGQRHRKLSASESRHRTRVQERLDEYELADLELRSAVKDAARNGLDVIEALGVAFENDNVRQLVEYEMDVA